VTADEELYRAWASGDPRAGSELVDRYLRPIGRFFANKLASDADVEEATSRVFEVCTRNLGRFREEGSFRSYVFGIAYNVLRETWRRRTEDALDFASSAAQELGPSPASVLHARREARLLLEALRSLPIELQTLIELSYFEGLSRREVARVLDMPVGTVASRLRRAHEILEERVDALASSADLARSTRTDLAGWADRLRTRLGREDPEADG
jgi:RNA polymerase sigma factor (sigma-70 family)